MTLRRRRSHGTFYNNTVSSDNRLMSGVTQLLRGWPVVSLLPYCISNVALMLLLSLVDQYYFSSSSSSQICNLVVSTMGHAFTTVIVSLLLVSRVATSLGRYQEAHRCVRILYQETRELAQNVCVLTKDSTDLKSKQWRNEVIYRTLILLRTAMAVIDYATDNNNNTADKIQPAWTCPELSGVELKDIQQSNYLKYDMKRWAHEERTESEENMRVPVRLAYLLRMSIHDFPKRLKYPIHVTQESTLLSNVDRFVGGYYSVLRFLTVPVPFPLVQTARTLLFLYVFTIPFALMADTNSTTLAHCFATFLLTYGFIGLELVATEMDYPFRNDENGVDTSALATFAYEDIYLTVLYVDGSEWVDNLRYRMHNNSSDPLPSEQSWLLSRIV